ncbi:holin family protein [Cognatishimia sp.]|uniref:holin family protein n=1 Tax=Cognatishimia sp. TaxID=2211648 RepID=UPI003515C73C|nr:holin family protein [Cognatishimia sp.]
MGVVSEFFGMLFGGRRNIVAETVEVFRPNAERQAQREATYNHAALGQFAAEFMHSRKGCFDRFVDGLNRLPRPAMALGCIALIVAAMYDPVWFSARMQGLALVPEPLWWLLGVVVSFYFGARHQAKSQDFQKSVAQTVALAPTVVENIRKIEKLHSHSPGVADTRGDVLAEVHATELSGNAAIDNWRAAR